MEQENIKQKGGARPGAGRKKGVKIGKIKPETVCFHRRVTPDEREFLIKALEEYRLKNK